MKLISILLWSGVITIAVLLFLLMSSCTHRSFWPGAELTFRVGDGTGLFDRRVDPEDEEGHTVSELNITK